jgi:glycosyltransferase involved in cell wall biosynthesis
MKIAVIGSKGLPPKQGGIEHHCAEVYPRMVAEGHTVDLFGRSQYTGRTQLTQYDYKGVNVISLPCAQKGGVDAFLNSAWAAVLASGKDYDIIHFHALGPALFSWIPRLFSPAKVVVTCHGLDWQRAKWGKIARTLILMGEKMGVACSHEFVTVSQALQSYFLETYDRRTAYVPNAPATYVPSDPNFTTIKNQGLEPGRYIVFLGRLVPEKCPDLLIKAFKMLKPAGWKLVLVGNSDAPAFKQELEELAANNPNIIFAGELVGAQLAETVRGAGMCVLPSNLEGLPMAMLEAMSEGVPIIASDIPPHRELLNDNRGLLFRKGDERSCMLNLDWAIHNPDDLQTMADRAKRYVRSQFNWDRITEKCLDLYRSVQEPTPLSEAENPQHSRRQRVSRSLSRIVPTFSFQSHALKTQQSWVEPEVPVESPNRDKVVESV